MQMHSTRAKSSSSNVFLSNENELGFEEVLVCKTLASATVWATVGSLYH